MLSQAQLEVINRSLRCLSVDLADEDPNQAELIHQLRVRGIPNQMVTAIPFKTYDDIDVRRP
jgi:hypothetical protein